MNRLFRLAVVGFILFGFGFITYRHKVYHIDANYEPCDCFFNKNKK